MNSKPEGPAMTAAQTEKNQEQVLKYLKTYQRTKKYRYTLIKKKVL